MTDMTNDEVQEWRNRAQDKTREWRQAMDERDAAQAEAWELLDQINALGRELADRDAELARLREAPAVAEIISKHGDPESFGERELRVLADIQVIPYGTKLYAAQESGT